MTIDIREFAEAMLEADDGFASRVKRFEARFGAVDADMLGVLAQAAYLCWGNNEYWDNLMEVCQAISMGKPTSSFYHAQITPERWIELHAYVVGVQCWIGSELPLPVGIDNEKITRIVAWLGEHSPVKDFLANLYLCQLIGLLLDTGFAKMGTDIPSEEYADFTPWYVRPDGTWYSEAPIEEYKQCVEREMTGDSESVDELLLNLLEPTNPPCLHRFSRHQDIRISSIGALKWRGNLPADEVPKANWEAFLDEVGSELRGWIDGAMPGGDPGRRLHEALGNPTEKSKAIVSNFLLADDRGSTASWHWLMQKDG
ncbi:hypothetical protein ACFL6S_01770 [Candidatus Poribacteria bacterium]